MDSRRLVGTANYGGLVLAALGFALTRFTVLNTMSPGGDLLVFLVGEALFLMLGLGLTAVGLALAVSDYEPGDVNVIAGWSLLGAGSMTLVVAVTAVEMSLGGGETVMRAGERLLRGPVGPRVLVAGAVGGFLTGVWSVSSRSHRRSLARSADRLTLLNRILRHEVLNKVGVVEGYADLALGERDDPDDPTRDRLETISDHAGAIAGAVEEVGVIATSGESGDRVRLDLAETVATEVATIREAQPDATVRLDRPSGPVPVQANRHLGTAVGHLLDNAVRHSDGAEPTVEVSVGTTQGTATVRVADDGPGMPPDQQSTLRARELPTYDDPDVGFGLAITRLLVEESGGWADVETPDAGGTVVTLAFARADGTPAGIGTEGVEPDRLGRVALVAVAAGVAMGGSLQVLTGDIAVIGALYGAENAAVGWIIHLFHSVVFGIGFAAVLATAAFRNRCEGVASCAGVGIGYGVLLWLVAAGLVMPVWLRAVGIPTPIPDLELPGLFGHVLWGLVLGSGVAALRRGE